MKNHKYKYLINTNTTSAGVGTIWKGGGNEYEFVKKVNRSGPNPA